MNLWKLLPFVLLGGSLVILKQVSSPLPTIANSEQYQILRVQDGDSLLVTRNSQQVKIRLCGIDAPESDQPFGLEAKQNLERLVSDTGGVAQIVETDRDRYGRVVAEVFLGSQGEVMAQVEQLSSGHAYLYRQYVSGCPNKSAFEDAEAIAKSQRAGVWSRPDLVKPWDHRRSR